MRKLPNMYSLFVLVVELAACVRQNARNLLGLLLGEGEILCVDSVPYAGYEGFVIATPSLRSKEDVLELFSSG